MELQVNRLAEQILWEKLTYSALCGVNAAAQVIIWSCVFELKNRFKCVFCWQFSTYMTCLFQLISQFEQMVKKKASFSLPLPVCVYCFLFFYKYSKPFRLFIGNLSLSWLMSLQKHVFFTTCEFSTQSDLFSSTCLISICCISQVWTWMRGPGRWEWRWTSTNRERALTPDWNKTTTRYKHVQIHHKRPLYKCPYIFMAGWCFI